jgi:TIR domain
VVREFVQRYAPKASPSRVFISYVREDLLAVSALASAIKGAGYEVWIDHENLGGGERWKGTIRNAIREGTAMIACFSSAYSERARTYMNEELTLAIDEIRSRPTDMTWFIPVRLDNCVVPDRALGAGETLRDIQAVDLFPDTSAGHERVLKAIARIVHS